MIKLKPQERELPVSELGRPEERRGHQRRQMNDKQKTHIMRLLVALASLNIIQLLLQTFNKIIVMSGFALL